MQLQSPYQTARHISLCAEHLYYGYTINLFSIFTREFYDEQSLPIYNSDLEII